MFRNCQEVKGTRVSMVEGSDEEGVIVYEKKS